MSTESPKFPEPGQNVEVLLNEIKVALERLEKHKTVGFLDKIKSNDYAHWNPKRVKLLRDAVLKAVTSLENVANEFMNGEGQMPV